MSGIDILIVSVILLCAALGVITGFVLQMAGILSVVIGILAAIILGPTAGDALGRWLSDQQLAALVGYVLVFSAAAVSVRIIAALCATLLAKLKLKEFDRLLGGAVGAIKGFAICAVIVVAYNAYGKNPQYLQNSYLAGPVVAIADWVMGKAEEHEVYDKVKDAAGDLKDKASNVGEKIRDRSREEGERELENRMREEYDNRME